MVLRAAIDVALTFLLLSRDLVFPRKNKGRVDFFPNGKVFLFFFPPLCSSDAIIFYYRAAPLLSLGP